MTPVIILDAEIVKKLKKRFAEQKLKLEQELANTREEYEKVKVESELNKKAKESLIKIEEIVLNKTKEKKTPKRQLEDDIETQVLKEAVVTDQEDDTEGLQQLLENKSKGYRRTSPSEKAARHDEIANAPPIHDSHTKPTNKNSKTTRLCHYFNNGRCSYQERCLFLHEEAPFCRYDGLCGREKCFFKHRNSPRSLEENFHQNQASFQNQQPWHWIFQPTVRPMYQQR